MKDSGVIEAVVAEVKGSGFWSMATEIRLRKLVLKMRAGGMTDDTLIAGIIRDFWLMAELEYGE